jgi:hypothetical protein
MRVVLAAASSGFPWGWDALTALSSVVLTLGLVPSVIALVQQRKRDQEAQAEAVRLQADAARREHVTRILVDAYRVLTDSILAPDDSYLNTLHIPMSMLQLVLSDDDLGILFNTIDQFRSVSAGSSQDLGPLLTTLRDRIRDNLGLPGTEQKFKRMRTATPKTVSFPQLVGLWLALTAEREGAGSPEVSRKQIADVWRLVQLLGREGERTYVGRIADEWESAGPERRDELLGDLWGWIRETQQIFH